MNDYKFGQKKNFIKRIPAMTWSFLIFAAILVIFIVSVKNISADTVDRQEEALSAAIERCVINCYCVEGTYPPSLEYIKEHYGLVYDENLFFIDYRPIGSNILPDTTIIRKDK